MKLALTFVKTGRMTCLSHLDLSRLFLRVLRMAGLRPDYSHGFNPHPKMSFALPLSLGFHSLCEALEFETSDGMQSGSVAAAWAAGERGFDAMRDALNARMPDGVRVTRVFAKPGRFPKTYASYVRAARYEIYCERVFDAPRLMESFFAREAVPVDVKGKARDIRPQMLGFRVVKDMPGRMLCEATLAAGPGDLLNPAVFFAAFCEASGLDAGAFAPVFTRTAILDGRAAEFIG